MRFFFAAVASCALFVGQAAQAQNVPMQMAIMTESPGEAGQSCDLDSAAFTAAIRAAMRYNRIDEVPREGSVPIIYVSTATLPRTCETNVFLQIKTYRISSHPMLGEMITDEVFCSQSSIIRNSNLRSAVSDLIKEQLDACLSEITSMTIK